MNKTLASLTLGLAAAGCPGGGTPGGYDGSGTPGGYDSGSSSDLAGAPRSSGVVTLTSNSFLVAGIPNASASASAGFGTAAMAPPCTSQTMGDCTTGTISITGGTKMVSLMPKADGSYAAYVDTMSGLWAGGEALTIVAGGSGVPAFSTKIDAPTVAKISMPVAPAFGTPLTVNRGTDLVIKWNVGPSNRVRVVQNTTLVAGSSVVVDCNFPAYWSTGTIPASALMNLPAGTGRFAIYTYNEQFVPAGDFDVTLTALSLATDTNSQLASYAATYQ